MRQNAFLVPSLPPADLTGQLEGLTRERPSSMLASSHLSFHADRTSLYRRKGNRHVLPYQIIQGYTKLRILRVWLSCLPTLLLILILHGLVALHRSYTSPAEITGLSVILCATPRRSRSDEAVNPADIGMIFFAVATIRLAGAGDKLLSKCPSTHETREAHRFGTKRRAGSGNALGVRGSGSITRMLGLFVESRPTLHRGHVKLRTQHLKADQNDRRRYVDLLVQDRTCLASSRSSHPHTSLRAVT